MKPVEDIRRDNLLILIKEAGSAAKLSLLTSVPKSYISQVSRGVDRGNGKRRVMGSDIARQLEKTMGRPVGWMDTDHSALSVASDLSGREGQLIGLFRILSDAEQVELITDLTNRLQREQRPATDKPDTRTRH